jgi:hypothetical protein
MSHKPLKSSILNLLKSSTAHLGIIVFAAFYISHLLYWQSNHLTAPDLRPKLLHLGNKALQKASNVTVGLNIHTFPNFSFYRNEFTIDGILWFQFPAGSESLQTIENFSIQNSIANGLSELLTKSKPIIKLIGDDVLVSYHIYTVIKTSLRYDTFPLTSRDNVNIIVQNRTTTPYELSFVSKDSYLTIDKENMLYDWKPVRQRVVTGYMASTLGDSTQTISYPTAIFTITFENIGIRDLISLYFPMFVLFFIALFSLLMSVIDVSRLSYVASSVPILVLFRFVIDAASPHVGTSTHLDFVYYLLVFLSLLILLFQTYVILTLYRVKGYEEHIQERTKRRLVFLNHLVFFGIMFLLLVLMTYTLFR